MALARKWEMNLGETSSVTLETLGTSTLQTAGLGAANSPALCRACPRVGVPLLRSWFHPPIVKEEQQWFTMVEGRGDGGFSLKVCLVPKLWIS